MKKLTTHHEPLRYCKTYPSCVIADDLPPGTGEEPARPSALHNCYNCASDDRAKLA